VAAPWVEGAAAAVFAVTFLLLALGRFAHWHLPRGAVSLAGGVLTALLLGVGWRAIDLQILLLLAGLMAMAGLAEATGLFAGLRRWILDRPPALGLWVALALVAVTSALLLNDAAVVLLVPLLLPVLVARGLPAVPVVVLMAVAANMGSLLTPYGNPQNAVLARAAGLGVADFLVAQGPLVILGLALLALPCALLARGAVPIPAPAAAPLEPRGRSRLLLCIAALGVAAATVASLGLGTLAAIAAGAALAGLLPILGRRAAQAAVRGIDLNVLALFVGLYLLTGGLPMWFPGTWIPTADLDGPWTSLAAIAALSNLVGNVPAILVLLRLDPLWTTGHAQFLVTTSTLGGALLLTGSAASLIAADQAKKSGVEVRFVPFLVHALWILPLVLIGAWWSWT
jgi:Na+/H+ antiporter NhaD/arsenite permease-like protein